MALDGVLRQRAQRHVPGVMLYAGLQAAGWDVGVLADESVGTAEQWMQIEGLARPSILIGDEIPIYGQELRQAQVIHARGLRKVEIVVDCDPLVIAWSLGEGLNSLLWCAPAYMSVSHRPDIALVPRPWDTMVGEIEAQDKIRLSDARRGWDSQSLEDPSSYE